MEKDYDRNTDIEETIPQDEFKRRQILFDGEPVEENYGGNSRGHRGCTSAAEKFQHRIHEQEDENDVREAGYATGLRELAAKRAQQAKEIGIDGLIASPMEAKALRDTVGRDLLIVTPGVRPAGAAAGDQKRVMTPGEAITAGADHLVVARPVIAAGDPRLAAEAIVAEIESALR